MAQAANGPRRIRDRFTLTRRQIVAAVLVVMLIAFIVDNTNRVRVGFVFFHARVPLIWVLLVTALIGVAADRLIQHRWRRAKSKQQKQA